MLKKGLYILIFSVLTHFLWGCFKEVAIPIEGDFTYKTSELIVPTTVTLKNETTGAESFLWTFVGGNPAQSIERNPVVVFNQIGTYKITLEARNLDGQKKLIEKTITITDGLTANINFKIKGTTYVPVEVQFESEIKGTNTQEWVFEGGIPAKSNEKNPLVQYNTGGPHKVSFKITNGFSTIVKDTLINLEPDLSAKFKLSKASNLFEDEAPVTYQIINDSKGAISYKWTMIGATPSASSAKEPSINYTEPGTYKIQLETTNGKLTKNAETEIVIAADKGFRIYTNLKFGIISAHDSLGSYFSTMLGQMIRGNDKITDLESSAIDIAFFGLDQKFSFIQFVSPQKVTEKGFEAIKLASSTKFLNNQILLSASDFDQLTKETLADLPIAKTLEITKFITLPLPKVVLFENAKGKKGAILVKELVDNGKYSYLIADIKVLK
jgi:PKD repeat protein